MQANEYPATAWGAGRASELIRSNESELPIDTLPSPSVQGLPRGLDEAAMPIIAKHFFGVDAGAGKRGAA